MPIVTINSKLLNNYTTFFTSGCTLHAQSDT